jgi:glycosyltransferase involved in cell wall biosynthesis
VLTIAFKRAGRSNSRGIISQMTKKASTLSIIIPAYNEEASIEKCLAARMDQTVRADEIIVVNNRSTDDTVAIVERIIAEHPEQNILLVHEDQQGLCPARNKGFATATSTILGRIDADAAIDPHWVEVVKDVFRDPEIDAATGPVIYHDMPLQKLGLRLDDRIRTTLYKLAKDHRFLFGSNMALRASAWHGIKDKVSPDADELLHEDIDIALTLHENGYMIAYAPEMVAALSARRLEDSPKEFYSYVMRFERTYKAHGVKSVTARVPIFIYLLIYFPVRTVRKFYDGDKNKFTLRKLREVLEEPAES